MPPINQQGSRAGLITTLVVFAILFITSSIFAFQFYGKYQNSEANYAQYQKRYTGVLPEGLLQSAPVLALQAARDDRKNNPTVMPTDSLVEVAMHQRDAVAGLVRGSAPATDNPAMPAFEESEATIKDSNAKLKAAGIALTLPATGLDYSITQLTSTAVAQQQQIASVTAELHDTQGKLTAATDDATKAAAASKEALDNLQKSDSDALAKANADLAALKTSYDQIQKDITASGTQTQANTQKTDADIAALNHQISDLEKVIATYKQRLALHRPKVEDAAVRQSDGKLIRVASNGICYINLGEGMQVTPGLTFEVYDKTEGVPGIPENASGDEQLPVGKGSIEITHVGTTSSECRVVHITPGAVLTEGDLIANLVYDAHTKYNFFVFGDFDLSNAGRPNAPDAEVIKRLITQWGGKVQGGDKPTPSTDFVVLGAEPAVPTFSKEDITAENQAKIDAAQAKLARYTEIEQEAKDLHIPVLNQNRFLYYVGFYDQAKR